MTEPARDNQYLLPERTRLFHIGLPKTGTTMLQTNAGNLRPQLLEHGVLYPGDGKRINHRLEVAGYMERARKRREVPSVEHWQRMMAEIEAEDQRRIWVSHEWASESSEAEARSFREALGDRVHIAVTLRHYGSSLPSAWQQYMKTGVAAGFAKWLEAVLREPPNTDMTRTFHVRSDHGLVVTRWAEIVGPENLTVIISDKTQPTLITDGFEDMLGLPRGLLTTIPLTGYSANRGLSVEESELLRSLNIHFKKTEEPQENYERWVRHGVAAELLRRRSPGNNETGFVLPEWAAARATERGNRYADQIEAAGVRVIGDMAALRTPAVGEESPSYERTMIPLDLATEALLGLIDAGKKQVQRATPKPVKQPKPVEPPKPVKTLAGSSGRELLREAARRARRRIRRTLSRRKKPVA